VKGVNDMEAISIAVCEDCLMAVANGDYPEDQARAEAIVAGETRWHGEGYHLAVGDEHDTFSWSRCDVCCTGLGGSRSEVVALPR